VRKRAIVLPYNSFVFKLEVQFGKKIGIAMVELIG
jgi:hypothetical protein